MPAITAAASARTSVFGPSVSRSRAAPPLSAATSIIVRVARNPAIDQTAVETNLGLMPCTRARSGFSADALTVRPTSVRLRNQPSANATIGTTTSTASCAPVTRTPSTSFQVWSTAGGYVAPKSVISGYAVTIASARPEMPMVETSTTTRGAKKSRRITTSSITAPKSVPTIRDAMAASQNGMSYSMTSSARRLAPTSPMLPTAKLMTRVDR